jgi:serine 3-dehydrogenase
MSRASAGTILITGASVGIGAATAKLFAGRGWNLALGARRLEPLDQTAEACRAAGAGAVFTAALDVTDRESIRRFVAAAEAAVGGCDVLVNNAGLARGVESIAEGDGGPWREMVETNVMGLLHVTREILPGMIRRGRGHVVMIGSIAGVRTYKGGGVYCATKKAVVAIAEAVRLETLGSGVRVTNIEPGLTETEFSLVRFSGDRERAVKPYLGLRPLTAGDVAECILFAVERPPHVNIDRLLLMPTDQAAPGVEARKGS